eukprot:2066617-Prymnesium_polylepis.1
MATFACGREVSWWSASGGACVEQDGVSAVAAAWRIEWPKARGRPSGAKRVWTCGNTPEGVDVRRGCGRAKQPEGVD